MERRNRNASGQRPRPPGDPPETGDHTRAKRSVARPQSRIGRFHRDSGMSRPWSNPDRRYSRAEIDARMGTLHPELSGAKSRVYPLIMRLRSTRWALLAMLLLQLGLGMPWSFALAHDVPAGAQTGDAGMQHCPDHGMGLDSAAVSSHSHQARHSGRHPPLNHGCCHGSSCLCYCTYPPAVFQPTLTGPIANFTHRFPASPAQFVATPTSERFRPPIA